MTRSPLRRTCGGSPGSAGRGGSARTPTLRDVPAALRSLWAEPRAPGAPRRLRRDHVVLAVAVAGLALEVALRADVSARNPTALLLLVLLPLTLARRTHPLLVVALAFGATAAAGLLAPGAPDVGSSAWLLLLPYALLRWGSAREAVAGLAVIATSAATGLLAERAPAADAIGGAVVLGVVAGLGLAVRARAAATARALEAVRSRERERLARDLHDSVAHHVSAIALTAQAGLATAGLRPGAATEALGIVEAEASRALAEMRDLVRVLRHDDAPAGGIAEVLGLAGGAPGGPVVAVDVRGDTADLPAAVAATVHRLAQEAVTNARRHARDATRVDVEVVVDPGGVRLRVHDDGAAPGRGGAGGYGLLGMRERAALLGGTCAAGPDPDGGWTVTASLPGAVVPR